MTEENPQALAPVQRLVGQLLLLQHQLDLMKAAYDDMKRQVECIKSANESYDIGVGHFMKERFIEWDKYIADNWTSLPNKGLNT